MGSMIYGASGVCMRCMRHYGSVWLVESDEVVFVCRTTSLLDDTPVCHDCLVVNGTSTFIPCELKAYLLNHPPCGRIMKR